MRRNKRTNDFKTCGQCQVRFVRGYGVSPVSWRSRRFCSTRCYAEHRKAYYVGPRNQFYLRGYTIVEGYKQISQHGVRDYEHRLVVEGLLGRQLESNEHVHHINGNRLDNRPDNLMVVTQAEHMLIHSTQRAFARIVHAYIR